MSESYYQIAREHMTMYGKDEIGLSKLLAVIIGNNSLPMTCHSLAQLSPQILINMTKEEFMVYEGIGPITASRLEASMALVREMSKMELTPSTVIRSPDDAANMFSHLKYDRQEQFVVAFLDTKNKVIGRKTIFKGTLNGTVVHAREVYREAIVRSSASIVVAHQHPSGNPSPSEEDIDVTKSLVKAGESIGIKLLDHIIIGNPSFVSLKEKGYI